MASLDLPDGIIFMNADRPSDDPIHRWWDNDFMTMEGTKEQALGEFELSEDDRKKCVVRFYANEHHMRKNWTMGGGNHWLAILAKMEKIDGNLKLWTRISLKHSPPAQNAPTDPRRAGPIQIDRVQVFLEPAVPGPTMRAPVANPPNGGQTPATRYPREARRWTVEPFGSYRIPEAPSDTSFARVRPSVPKFPPLPAEQAIVQSVENPPIAPESPASENDGVRDCTPISEAPESSASPTSPVESFIPLRVIYRPGTKGAQGKMPDYPMPVPRTIKIRDLTELLNNQLTAHIKDYRHLRGIKQDLVVSEIHINATKSSWGDSEELLHPVTKRGFKNVADIVKHYQTERLVVRVRVFIFPTLSEDDKSFHTIEQAFRHFKITTNKMWKNKEMSRTKAGSNTKTVLSNQPLKRRRDSLATGRQDFPSKRRTHTVAQGSEGNDPRGIKVGETVVKSTTQTYTAVVHMRGGSKTNFYWNLETSSENPTAIPKEGINATYRKIKSTAVKFLGEFQQWNGLDQIRLREAITEYWSERRGANDISAAVRSQPVTPISLEPDDAILLRSFYKPSRHPERAERARRRSERSPADFQNGEESSTMNEQHEDSEVTYTADLRITPGQDQSDKAVEEESEAFLADDTFMADKEHSNLSDATDKLPLDRPTESHSGSSVSDNEVPSCFLGLSTTDAVEDHPDEGETSTRGRNVRYALEALTAMETTMPSQDQCSQDELVKNIHDLPDLLAAAEGTSQQGHIEHSFADLLSSFASGEVADGSSKFGEESLPHSHDDDDIQLRQISQSHDQIPGISQRELVPGIDRAPRIDQAPGIDRAPRTSRAPGTARISETARALEAERVKQIDMVPITKQVPKTRPAQAGQHEPSTSDEESSTSDEEPSTSNEVILPRDHLTANRAGRVTSCPSPTSGIRFNITIYNKHRDVLLRDRLIHVSINPMDKPKKVIQKLEREIESLGHKWEELLDKSHDIILYILRPDPSLRDPSSVRVHRHRGDAIYTFVENRVEVDARVWLEPLSSSAKKA